MQNCLLRVDGIIAVPGDVCAQFNPIALTLTATTAVPWLVWITCALQIVSAFGRLGKHALVRTAAFGAIAIFIGCWFLYDPVAGTMPLTSTVGLVFLAEGLVKLQLAIATHDTHFLGMVVLLGKVSVLPGGMILAQFPAAALTIRSMVRTIKFISIDGPMVARALHVSDRTQED